MQFQRFHQVGESFLFALTLAGHVYFEALGNIPIPLAPCRSMTRFFHTMAGVRTVVERVRYLCGYLVEAFTIKT